MTSGGPAEQADGRAQVQGDRRRSEGGGSLGARLGRLQHAHRIRIAGEAQGEHPPQDGARSLRRRDQAALRGRGRPVRGLEALV